LLLPSGKKCIDIVICKNKKKAVVQKDAWARIEEHGRELRHMGVHGAAWTHNYCTAYAWLE